MMFILTSMEREGERAVERINSHIGFKVIGLMFSDPELREQGGGVAHFRRKGKPAQQVRIAVPPQSLNHEQMRELLDTQFLGTLGELRYWEDAEVEIDMHEEHPTTDVSTPRQYLFSLDGDGFAYDAGNNSAVSTRSIAPGEYEWLEGLLFQIETGEFERV